MARKLNTGKRGGSTLKDGIYQLRIEDVEEKTSANSGNDYLNIRFSVLRNGSPFGRSIFDILVFSESSEWKFQQLFDALDAPENQEVSIQWLKGKDLYASLVTDEYGGNIKNVVKSYIDPSVAEDLLKKQASSPEEEDDSVLSPMFSDEEETPVSAPSGRGRKRNQPAEMQGQEESMPL